MDNNDFENRSAKFISEGIIVLLLTVLLYVIAFNYYIGYISFYTGNFNIKIGFFDYYRTPSIFTDISLYKIILYSYKIYLLIGSAVMLTAVILLFIERKNKFLLKLKYVKYTIISLIVTLLSAYKIGFDHHIFILSFGPTLIIVSIEIIGPFLMGIQEKGFNNKIKKGQKQLYQDNLLYYIFRKYYYFFIIFLLIGFFAPYAAQIGNIDGERKVDYFILNDAGKSYAIIDNNGDKYIVIPIDIKNKTFESKFQIISADSLEDKNVVVECKSIGPLKIKI